MRTFTVGNNDKDKRLDKFLSKVMPYAPMSLIYKSLRKKQIKVNSKRVTDGNLKLNQGDVLEIYINDEFFTEIKPKYDFLSAPKNIDIVYEDENILLADKKQGLLVHPDKNEYTDTLIARIQHYLYYCIFQL